MPKRKPPQLKPAPPPTPPPAPPKRREGRPEHQPDKESRARVVAMVIAEGAPDQDMIARRLGISAPTLRKHYRYELDISGAVIKSEIAAGLVTKARNGDLKAQMFFLETHGWVRSERHIVADGGIDDSDLFALSDDQLKARLARIDSHKTRTKRTT